MPSGVNQQSPGRSSSAVRAAREVVNHTKRPRASVWRQLVDDAHAESSTRRSRAIDIAFLVDAHWTAGPRTIGAGKGMYRALSPRPARVRDLEHNSAPAFA